jgi:hypothetical protein
LFITAAQAVLQLRQARPVPVLGRIQPFVVGEDGQALIHHYRVAGEEKSEIANKIDYPAITKLTSDMVRCADCEVEVVQTESLMQIA